MNDLLALFDHKSLLSLFQLQRKSNETIENTKKHTVATQNITGKIFHRYSNIEISI